MSKQSKNARKLAWARTVTALHKSGKRGPASTTPTNTKRNTWWRKKLGTAGVIHANNNAPSPA